MQRANARAAVPIAVADEAELDDLRDRLRRTRWPEREAVDDWSQGIPLAYVQELCAHWADDYDWRRVEAELNRFQQLRFSAGRRRARPLGIQVLHAPSPRARTPSRSCSRTGGPDRSSSSSTSSSRCATPPATAGTPADAFHVVCPTMPGYGFSDKPTRPGCGVEHIADVWVG